MQKQEEILKTLHPVKNQITLDYFVYEPGKLPDFSMFDASCSSEYSFPPTQFKTISLFVSKVKECHFAEADFEPLIQKEQQYVPFNPIVSISLPFWNKLTRSFSPTPLQARSCMIVFNPYWIRKSCLPTSTCCYAERTPSSGMSEWRKHWGWRRLTPSCWLR